MFFNFETGATNEDNAVNPGIEGIKDLVCWYEDKKFFFSQGHQMSVLDDITPKEFHVFLKGAMKSKNTSYKYPQNKPSQLSVSLSKPEKGYRVLMFRSGDGLVVTFLVNSKSIVPFINFLQTYIK
jgi:hypothetical protein